MSKGIWAGADFLLPIDLASSTKRGAVVSYIYMYAQPFPSTPLTGSVGSLKAPVAPEPPALGRDRERQPAGTEGVESQRKTDMYRYMTDISISMGIS